VFLGQKLRKKFPKQRFTRDAMLGSDGIVPTLLNCRVVCAEQVRSLGVERRDADVFSDFGHGVLYQRVSWRGQGPTRRSQPQRPVTGPCTQGVSASTAPSAGFQQPALVFSPDVCYCFDLGGPAPAL